MGARLIKKIREWGKSPASEADVIAAAVAVPVVTMVALAVYLMVVG